MAPWGGPLVRWLLKRGIGKHIRSDGPTTHQTKAGTATMGGLYFLAGAALVALALATLGYRDVWGPLAALLVFGVLGAFDDLQGLKDRQGVGWLARSKFPVQWAAAILVALALYWLSDHHVLVVPVSGAVVEIGGWFVPLAAVLVVGMSNAVNLTDGLDGLAAGIAACAYGVYGTLAAYAGQQGLALLCLGLVGALAAFLWFNVNPARMFMGDVGSEALGAGLAAVAILTGHWLLLPLIAIVFVAEALSVMLQVSYFKLTKRRFGEGRRILKMAPLHRHFELLGWKEVQVTQRFWIVGLLAGLLGLALGVA
ncbi:MAG: phospho-N-acetylmuramoyl-pentapeptide-transferase [Chloroflexi bacterium]|nr:phospho-N-acetylmuramoyl-pentapeptide-transferase [Chloroflexota bacterium]